MSHEIPTLVHRAFEHLILVYLFDDVAEWHPDFEHRRQLTSHDPYFHSRLLSLEKEEYVANRNQNRWPSVTLAEKGYHTLMKRAEDHSHRRFDGYKTFLLGTYLVAPGQIPIFTLPDDLFTDANEDKQKEQRKYGELLEEKMFADSSLYGPPYVVNAQDYDALLAAVSLEERGYLTIHPSTLSHPSQSSLAFVCSVTEQGEVLRKLRSRRVRFM